MPTGSTVSTPSTAPASRWDDLVDRLRAHDVRYLTGGSADDIGHRQTRRRSTDTDTNQDIRPLIADLSHAPQARLRDALVALLFRHPEYAACALAVAADSPADDRARLVVQTSILAAASLQRAWSFTLDIYLPAWQRIDGESAKVLGVPFPDEDYGRPCLHAVSALLARDQPFPYDYEHGWQDVASLILADLCVEARLAGRP